eukprot:8710013-Alexandrium_andersonii.AAC.1
MCSHACIWQADPSTDSAQLHATLQLCNFGGTHVIARMRRTRRAQAARGKPPGKDRNSIERAHAAAQ